MTLSLRKQEDLAAILHAYEDSESVINDIEDPDEFEEYLIDYVDNYHDNLSEERKRSLRESVCWLAIQPRENPRELVRELYQRIWNHNPDIDWTNAIIDAGDIDFDKYVAGIEEIFAGLDCSSH